MPRAFDESEQAAIRERLLKVGHQLFTVQGVVKTSVQDLTRAAGIAKGSFYKFYENKELLFFELLEQSQNRIRGPMLAGRNSRTPASRKQFVRILRHVFDELCNDPFIRVLGQDCAFAAVTRKLSAERLQQHQIDDQAFIGVLIDKWNTRPSPPPAGQVAASLTMLVLLSLQRDFMGEHLLPYAVESTISSLCDCFFGDEPAPQKPSTSNRTASIQSKTLRATHE